MVTPLKRNSFAVGKVISLSVFALLNGISSFVGTVLAMPKMLGDTVEVTTSIYGIKEYGYLLLVICSSVLFIISILSIISAISKTAKEASSMCSPLMIGATLLGAVTNMQFDMSATAWRLVPVLNSILCINDVLEFSVIPINIVITCLCNIAYTVILTYLLTRLLNNEKVVFSK
jgi:sodium transport system permease protein